VALREAERKAWKAWASAKVACDQGLVARPLWLFVQATELASPAVNLDAAEFALNLNRNLERLAPIYQRHARSFGLAEDAYPIYLPETKIGPEGWEFVLNCLLAANVSAPSRLDIQDQIADLLEERGRLGEALAWRNGIEVTDLSSLGNSMAIGRLLAKTGHIADAVAHYRRINAQRPDNAEVLLRLVSIYSAEKEKSNLLAAVDRIDRALAVAEKRSDAEYQAFFLGLVLAIVRQWPISPSRELLHRLRRRCDRLLLTDQSSVCVLFADALLGLVESDFGRSARPRLCKATIEVERAKTATDIPTKAAETVAEAANYARVLISHPGFPGREREPLPAVNAAVLAREQARTLLGEGKAGDALPKYAASLKSYHVTDVPTQYELVGNHKLVLHEQCYYLIPRDVQEFMIWEGTVYRLTGIGRHTRRHIPGWLISLLFPCVSPLRNLRTKAREWSVSAAIVGAAMVVEYGHRMVQSVAWAGRIGRKPAKAISRRAVRAMRRIDGAVPQLRSLLRPAVRLAYTLRYCLRRRRHERAVVRPHADRRFHPLFNRRLRPVLKAQHDRLVQTAKVLTDHLKRVIFKIIWRRYAVEGVVTAPRREAALALFAKISNVPLAGDEGEPRVVRRARLTRTSPWGPEA
jgi:tetratricopeptide (TPR) repeat protein